MIALDANILVYAHRQDSEWHGQALQALRRLAEGRSPWAIPWPCLYEFYSISTHPRIYSPPSTPMQAVEQIEIWLEAPHLVLLSESPVYTDGLLTLLRSTKPRGGMVHDARIAALCQGAGIQELWTADRDFSRFPDLSCRNPLIDTSLIE